MAGNQCWKPKVDAPPYITVKSSDIWGQVKAKWEKLGSPEAQCPSPQFGLPGSPENEACKARVAPLWEKFEDIFPDYPPDSPYGQLVDLVQVGEICQMGVFDDPEEDIGPVPNLFENPSGLAQKLMEWHLRSLVPTYCERCNNTPGTGSCSRIPYWVDVRWEEKDLQGNPLPQRQTRGQIFGPVKSVSLETYSLGTPEEPRLGYGIFLEGSGPDAPGEIPPWAADGSRFIQQVAGSDNSGEWSNPEIIAVQPMPQSAWDFYGWGPIPDGLSENSCPVPTVTPPLPPMPNSTPFYMPLPVPVFSFPPATSCPSGTEDFVNFVVNFPETPGLPGPPGEKGEKGDPGEGYMRLPIRKNISSSLGIFETDSGDFGGIVNLPEGIAYVEVSWKLKLKDQLGNRLRSFFQCFDPNRCEYAYGNFYLRSANSGAMLAPFVHGSTHTSRIAIPDGIGATWQLVVNDKTDVGFDVQDDGWRWVTRKILNPDDVPEIYYNGD